MWAESLMEMLSNVLSCPSAIKIPAPALNPTITEWDTKLITLPSFMTPKRICKAPTTNVIKNRIS